MRQYKLRQWTSLYAAIQAMTVDFFVTYKQAKTVDFFVTYKQALLCDVTSGVQHNQIVML